MIRSTKRNMSEYGDSIYNLKRYYKMNTVRDVEAASSKANNLGFRINSNNLDQINVALRNNSKK